MLRRHVDIIIIGRQSVPLIYGYLKEEALNLCRDARSKDIELKTRLLTPNSVSKRKSRRGLKENSNY